MANDWKTSKISFHADTPTNLLSLGKTHDLMPARIDEGGKEKADNKHTEEVLDSLPSWVEKPNPSAVEWEHKREDKLIELRNNPTYQFVMLVTSFTNERMDKYWNVPSELGAEHQGTKQVGTTTAPNTLSDIKGKNVDIRFHNFYADTPWLDGIIYLSPAMYGHIEEAYCAITQKYEHLDGVKLSHFTNTPKIRTWFAKLTALNIRASDFLSQKKYNLDSTWSRINFERQRLMNYWKKVKLVDNTLMYFRSGGFRSKPSNPFQIEGNDIQDSLFNLSKEISTQY